MTDDPSVTDLRAFPGSCIECGLRTRCLPAGLDIVGIERVDRLIHRPPPLARGDRLFRADEPLEHVHVVRSGSLKTVYPEVGGGGRIVGFHLPGDLLGLDAISNERHRCDAVALERASVCAVPFERLERLAADLPALQRQLHRIISREMQTPYRHLATVGRNSASERVAGFMADLSQRLANVGHSPTDLQLSMLREDIASYLGLAVATVSRALGRLSDHGLLEIDHRRIRVLDPDGLARLAGHCGGADSTAEGGRGRDGVPGGAPEGAHARTPRD